uniref:Uncharacterized protein n=1 Tax=Chelydra serpentina TaxID=8475 RepID=A0A8C3XN99_CHESE
MILTLSSVLNKPKALSLPTHPHLSLSSISRLNLVNLPHISSSRSCGRKSFLSVFWFPTRKYFSSRKPDPHLCKTILKIQKPFPKSPAKKKNKINTCTVHDRAILVETELHLVIDVLENFGDPSLSEQLVRPLEILRHIREDLKSCVSTGLQITSQWRWGEAGRMQSHGWLHTLEEYAPLLLRCLEASVILNLFRLLNNDLKCAAYMEFCT